jgi:hypothetical protein
MLHIYQYILFATRTWPDLYGNRYLQIISNALIERKKTVPETKKKRIVWFRKSTSVEFSRTRALKSGQLGEAKVCRVIQTFGGLLNLSSDTILRLSATPVDNLLFSRPLLCLPQFCWLRPRVAENLDAGVQNCYHSSWECGRS